MIKLTISGNLIEATGSPDPFELFCDHFRYTLRKRADYKTAQLTGQKYISETKYLIYKSSNGAVFPVGFLFRAKKLLGEQNIEYTISDLRNLDFKPDLTKLEHDKLKERPDQQRALATIFVSDMGVIEAPTAFGKTFLICQICRAYPKQRIIISSYRADVIKSIYDRVKEHVPYKDLGFVGQGSKKVGRITLSTINSLDYARPDKCDIFLYDEVHEAASDMRARKIASIRNAKIFGFSASPRGRSDGSDLVIEALFGPIIYKLKYDEAVAAGVVAQIYVEIYEISGHEVPYSNEIAQYRFGIWRNEVRNQKIAEAANKYLSENKQVLIIVDKIEHALFLKSKFLPSWPIVHGLVTREQIQTFKAMKLLTNEKILCTPEQREIYRRMFESGKMRYAIATGVWSQGIDMRHLDVLIRGDGKASRIPSTQIPGRLSRGKSGILVDFLDIFDERFRRRSNERIKVYKEKGWEIRYHRG